MATNAKQTEKTAKFEFQTIATINSKKELLYKHSVLCEQFGVEVITSKERDKMKKYLFAFIDGIFQNQPFHKVEVATVKKFIKTEPGAKLMDEFNKFYTHFYTNNNYSLNSLYQGNNENSKSKILLFLDCIK